MAAVIGEELLATEAAAGAEAGAAEGAGGQFQYSGGGIGGANYGADAIGFEGFGNPEAYAAEYRGVGLPENPKLGDTNGIGGSSAFRPDTKPRGLSMSNLYAGDFFVSKVGGVLQGITNLIATTYNNYRKDKELRINSRENLKDRYRAGIVFRGQENRDQLVRSNKMPAYYSTSNIKSLLRRCIMPFGWNSEMAIEQGFGHEIFAQEQKAVTERNAKELFQREKDKIKLQRSLGELRNLRDKLKTRKILEYYNQN